MDGTTAVRQQVFDDVPADDSGLKGTLAALKSVVRARDFNTFWGFHKGLRDAATAGDVPEDMMQRMISITVETGKPGFNDIQIGKRSDNLAHQVCGHEPFCPLTQGSPPGRHYPLAPTGQGGHSWPPKL